MRSLLVLLALWLVGCASSGSFEKDKRDAGYQSGDYARPFVGQPTNPQPGSQTDPSTAAAGLAVGGIASAIEPDYHKDKRIRGRCSCRINGTDNLRLMCPRATIILLDDAGKEVARQQSANGEFAFDVDKKGTYRLSAQVPNHYSRHDKPIPAKSGDELVLEFFRK